MTGILKPGKLETQVIVSQLDGQQDAQQLARGIYNNLEPDAFLTNVATNDPNLMKFAIVRVVLGEGSQGTAIVDRDVLANDIVDALEHNGFVRFDT
jgi:hypothetical protein